MPEEIEVDTDNLRESIDREIERQSGGLLRTIALTTALFAALAAIASLEAGGTVNEALALKTEATQLQAEASDQWSYYQAKGLKAAVADAQKNIWLAPVGRLDKASEGLLLLTNDSEWAARITDPNSHLDKTYHVQIGIVAGHALLGALERGVSSGAEHLRAKRATLLRQGERNSWLEVVLDEGKNRQIRRMFEAQQIAVLRLIRVAIGPLPLGDLTKGAARALTQAEVAQLTRRTINS